MNIILFGPPGAGKGTQAKYLQKKLDNYQISTGDMLRNEIKNNTDIGKKIINNMNEGKFVDDGIVNQLIEKVIRNPKNKNKLIFDGYPRTIDQAKNLDLLLENTDQKIDFIFFLKVDKETIIKRIENRKVLEQRSDDELDVTIKRYEIYMETTRPVLDYYSLKSNFKEIDGGLKIDEISRKINNILKV